MNRENKTALEVALHFAMSTAADGARLIAHTQNDPRYSIEQRAAARGAIETLEDLVQLAARGFQNETELEAFLFAFYATLSKLATADIHLVTLGVRRDYPLKRDK